MGFTIADYPLLGLLPQNFYCTINGAYTITKDSIVGNYNLAYSYTLSAAKGDQVIYRSCQITLTMQDLPGDLWVAIYADCKARLGDYTTTDC